MSKTDKPEIDFDEESDIDPDICLSDPTVTDGVSTDEEPQDNDD